VGFDLSGSHLTICWEIYRAVSAVLRQQTRSHNRKLRLADVPRRSGPYPALAIRFPREYVATIGPFPNGSIDSHIRVPTRLWREGVMALNITKSGVHGVTVIHLSGAILFGEESKSLFIHVKDLLNKTSQIVLDLSDVTRIDSGGLGTQGS
jgi:hypothetical protein